MITFKLNDLTWQIHATSKLTPDLQHYTSENVLGKDTMRELIGIEFPPSEYLSQDYDGIAQALKQDTLLGGQFGDAPHICSL